MPVSLLHLMRAIARAHASKRATSLMRVKNSMRHTSAYGTYCLGHWKRKKQIKERAKTSNLIVD